MIRLFVSYSHADDAFRKSLQTALALLERQGLVDVWTDQAILPGQEIDPAIAAELEAADVLILLISQDFLASNYCFDKEMARALERHRAGEAVVIPLIVRPSSWQQTPLGAVKAIPRDGKPVSKYDDPDDAWHEIETEIRRLIEALNRRRADPSPSAPGAPAPVRALASVAMRLPRSFSDADRDDFIDEAFDTIADSFTASLQELEDANPGVKGRLRRKDADEFAATVYRDGREIAACRVFRAKQFRTTDIYFSYEAAGMGMQYNESLSAADDDAELRLRPLGMANFGKADRSPAKPAPRITTFFVTNTPAAQANRCDDYTHAASLNLAECLIISSRSAVRRENPSSLVVRLNSARLRYNNNHAKRL